MATLLAKFLPNAFSSRAFSRRWVRLRAVRRLKGHLRWLQPHYLADAVFTDPPGVPSHFNDFFGHLDDCAKPLSVTLVSGNSLTNLPHAFCSQPAFYVRSSVVSARTGTFETLARSSSSTSTWRGTVAGGVSSPICLAMIFALAWAS
jgi:hypothetical protein